MKNDSNRCWTAHVMGFVVLLSGRNSQRVNRNGELTNIIILFKQFKKCLKQWYGLISVTIYLFILFAFLWFSVWIQAFQWLREGHLFIFKQAYQKRISQGELISINMCTKFYHILPLRREMLSSEETLKYPSIMRICVAGSLNFQISLNCYLRISFYSVVFENA